MSETKTSGATRIKTAIENMRTPIKDLSAETVGVQPRDADWSSYPETFEFWEAQRCEDCRKILVGTCGDNHSELDDDESECRGYVPQSEGPMMNYFYPLPHFDGDLDEAARKLIDLPLCVVQFADTEEVGLALTGGGMDLSWQICEAYMLLGYLPPLHYARSLPQFAGLKADARHKWILAGARASAFRAIRSARFALRDIRNVSKGLERS